MSYIGGTPLPTLTAPQIYQHALDAGFTGQAAITATAIGMAESSGVPNNFNPSDPHGGSVGLMQINGANASLLGGSNWLQAGTDPAASMGAAYSLYSNRGGFTDWGTYTNGAYQSFMPAAQAAAANYTGPGATANYTTNSDGTWGPSNNYNPATGQFAGNDLPTGVTIGGQPGPANPSSYSGDGPGESQSDAITHMSLGGANAADAASVGVNNDPASYPALSGSMGPGYDQSAYGQIGGLNAPVGTGEVGTTAPSGTSEDQKTGSPLYVTNAGAIGVAAANEVAKALTNLNQGVQTSEQTGIKADTSLLGSIANSLGDWFVRGGFIALGLVVLAGAFLFFYMEGKSPQMVVQEARA